MRRTRAALSGLVCAFAAVATPAAAFTAIDPLTRQPLYSTEESARAQASPIPARDRRLRRPPCPGHHRGLDHRTSAVLRAGRRQGRALRRWRRASRLSVGRSAFRHHEAGMAGLAPAGCDAQAPPGSAPPHGRRPGEPARARALYIGSTIYRIHGSNEPETIGEAVSSGCIRMTNEDVTDLYSRAKVGARVVVQR